MPVEAAGSAPEFVAIADLSPGIADPDSCSCPPPPGSWCAATRGEVDAGGWCGAVEDPGVVDEDMPDTAGVGSSTDPDANLVSAIAVGAGRSAPSSAPPPAREHMK